MKPLTRSAVRTHQYCCVSSLRVSFSVENYRSIRNNRASRLFEGAFHPRERGCASSSPAGNICSLGNRKIRAIDCCSLPDDDMDNSLVTEPNKTGYNSVLEDAAFLFKLVGVSFAGELQCSGCSLMKTGFCLAER